MHRRITGKLVIATHNPGKLAEMRELLAPHGVEAVSAGELGLGEPDETGDSFRANARIKAIAAAQGGAASGLRRRFRIGGRCARRRARNFFGALGRPEQGFYRGDGADRAPAAGARRDHAATAQGAFRLRAVRRLARRSSRGGRGARRRHFGVAAARHRRLRLRSGVHARRTCAHLRRDDQRSRSTACRRSASACRTAPAPSSSWRRSALSRAEHLHAAGRKPSASMCTGRFACRNARIAISTAMSGMPRSTKNVLRAPLRARSRPPPRARRAARSPRSFSAAARRR